MSPTWKDPSPPPLDGELRFDDRARAATADDFGHLVRRTPAAVLLPGSDDDVAATVRWAAEHGRGFAAQGQRHSVFGRGQVADGVVVDMRSLRAIRGVEHDRVAVDAGRPGGRCSRPRCRGGSPRPGCPTTWTCRSAARWWSVASAARSRGSVR